MTDRNVLEGENAFATVSNDELYRYDLGRAWEAGPTVCWVMLNPSTADASEDDPTIRRVRSFSKREGFGGFVVVNLFALRVTRPIHLAHHPDPVGPMNNRYIVDHVLKADSVIAAWGMGGKRFNRDIEVRKEISIVARGRQRNVLLRCLGITQAGMPRHPLYVRWDTALEDYEWEKRDG